MSDLQARIAAAEKSGNVVELAAIARSLMPKPKRPRTPKSGPQTWALVTLADGRQYLTSAFQRSSEAATLAAHGGQAQVMGSMEHLEHAPVGEYLLANGRPLSPVAAVAMLTKRHEIAAERERCFRARLARQGNQNYRKAA